MNADNFGCEQVVILQVSSYFRESQTEQTKFTRMHETRGELRVSRMHVHFAR